MIWMSWRLQRTETLVAAGILALIALLLIPTGLQEATAYHHDGLAACQTVNPTFLCANELGSFASRFAPVSGLIVWMTLVPGLLGAALAAPFVLELENGTYRFAWTQSVTRGRWLAGKLGLAAGTGLLVALGLSLLVTWWKEPFVRLDGRLDSGTFDFAGTVVFGYVLFALGLTAALGALWKRAVPALIVTLAGYFALRVFVDTWLRQRLVSPLGATWKSSTPGPNLGHDWVLSQGPSDRSGHYLLGLPSCVRQLGTGSGLHVRRIIGNCGLGRSGYTHAVYQPASHFWALQGIETALFGGAGLALIAIAVWWTHERTG